MLVRKCDVCKKRITDVKKSVTAGVGYDRYEPCLKCGAPIIRILKSRKLA